MSGKALEAGQVPTRTGSSYPDPFDRAVRDRKKKALGDAFGLTHFGVNLVELPPGAWSAQRHWHSREDELVYVLEGELTLVTDRGEERLTAGMTIGFPAGASDGHHLINRSNAPAVYLEIGDRIDDDECHYPDVDLFLTGGRFLRKDGRTY